MITDLTPTQRTAFERRKAFHASIAAKATERKMPTVKAKLAPKPEQVKPEPVVIAPQSDKPWFEILDEQVYSIANIQQVVAKYYGVTRRDILSCRRTKDVMIPRHVAVYIAKELTPFSLPVLGRHFGGRDHTTQLNSIKRVREMLRTDDNFAFEVASLFIQITGSAQ